MSKKILLLSKLCLLVLTSCGGGGDNPGPTPGPTPSYTSFSDDTWNNVITYANQGLSKLHEVYKNDCDANTAYPGTLIGLEKIININTKDHVVKVIGEEHDTKSEGGKVALTFDFTTYISDSSGTPIEINWHDDVSQEWSTSKLKSYMTTVKDLFPSEIKSALKTVKKQTYDIKTSQNVEYDEIVFPLTVKEVGYSSQYAKETTNPYKYYEKEIGENSDLRRKKYTSGKLPAMGDPYWFRSADTHESGATSWFYAFDCSGYNGHMSEDFCYPTTTHTIAPAFCI